MKIEFVDSKGIVFFFPGKVCGSHTHSISEVGRKKKNKLFFFFPAQNFQFLACFFFPQEKFTLHSLTQNQRPEKKKTAPEKKNKFFTHTKSAAVKEKKTAPEKKKQLFHSLTRILSKSGEKQTFPGKKKIRYL